MREGEEKQKKIKGSKTDDQDIKREKEAVRALERETESKIDGRKQVG